MKIWIFSSETLRNIRLGYNAGMWAVSSDVSHSTMQRRITNSKHMPPGSNGLIYCSKGKFFTMPFETVDWAEERLEKSIWAPKEWFLPFKIKPLGSPDTQVRSLTAKQTWPFLKGCENLTQRINGIAGSSVFIPTEIELEDWEAMIRGLGDPRTQSKN